MRKFIYCWCWSTLLFLVAAPLPSVAQKKKKQVTVDRFAGLDTAFERVLQTWKGVGFAVAVVEKDKIIYAKGFGHRDLAAKLPVTPNTLFAIGSCTKAFTAAGLGILQAGGKLQLDQTVTHYLPQLKFTETSLNDNISLRDMMSHRTGLPRHDYSWYAFPSKSRDSLLRRLAHLPPSAPLRQKWQYNNFMFLLQGMVTEKISGTTWEQFTRKEIFQPLGMVRSNFSVNDMGKDSDAALGYEVLKDSIVHTMPYYNIDAMGPAGSINSSVNEMAQWVMTWINGGQYKGKQVIPAAYYNEAISSQMVIGAALPTKEKPDVHFSNYGLGWFLASYKGHYRVEHGGNIDGFSASTCFFPSDSVGIVVLSNQNGSRIPGIVRNLLADRVLGLPYFDWNTDSKKSADSAKIKTKAAASASVSNQQLGTRPSRAWADFAGAYHHPGYGTIVVEQKKDSLFVQLGKEKIWLKHFHYDVFEPFDVDATTGIDTSEHSLVRVRFSSNDAGELNEMFWPMEPTLPSAKFERQARPIALPAADLKKYVGLFVLTGVEIKTYLKNEQLYVFVPGQPEYALAPLGKDRFQFVAVPGYAVQFELDSNNNLQALVFQQPNGNFKAIKK